MIFTDEKQKNEGWSQQYSRTEWKNHTTRMAFEQDSLKST
jgi:hypothetical protein